MHRFTAELWLWDGDAPWHFVTVPEDVSDAVEHWALSRPTAFGSVRVEVTVGETTWRTSLFPDSKTGGYVLPVKKDVRQREGLDVGTEVAIRLRPLASDTGP